MTLLDHAKSFIGLKEVAGAASNPAILAMLQLDAKWPTGDETPWCSAFANFVTSNCGLERSRSLAARSWLKVGEPIARPDAQPGDVVILKRGAGVQPGPEVLNASGHVGFVSGFENGKVLVLGGNQGDSVSIAAFPEARVLGYRRLRPVAAPAVQTT